jgi:hypothetical protein
MLCRRSYSNSARPWGFVLLAADVYNILLFVCNVIAFCFIVIVRDSKLQFDLLQV